MFEIIDHLTLIIQTEELLDRLYPEQSAAQYEDIYQFRNDVLDQLNQAKLDPKANHSILISFIKQLQSIANEQDEVNTTLSLHNHAHASNIASYNRLAKGAKIKSKVVNNHFYPSVPTSGSSPQAKVIEEEGAYPAPQQPKFTSMPSLLPDYIERTEATEAIKGAIENTKKELARYVEEKDKNPSIRFQRVNIFLISGTNGVGKTSLARELFEDLYPHYSLAAWIDASAEKLYNDFCLLGKELNVDIEGKSPERIIRDIHKKLAENSSVLLVFDGAKNKNAIHKYVPQNLVFKESQYCHCLVTSNEPDKLNKYSFDLDVFSKEEAKKYIKKKLEKIRSKLSIAIEYDIEKYDEEKDLYKLIIELEAFPLALAQAMAYIENKGSCSIKQYFQALENNKTDTLSNYLPNTENYKKTVMTTWEITMHLVNQQNHLAEKVLEICAYLYSNKISKEFLQVMLEKYGILEKYKEQYDSIDEALHLLFQCSLLKKLDSKQNGNVSSSYTFRIHALLQNVIREKIKHVDNMWWKLLNFRIANQHHLLRSIDDTINELFYVSLTKQDKLEIVSHWEVIMTHKNNLKSYYIGLPFTSVLDFFDMEDWFIVAIGLILSFPLFYILHGGRFTIFSMAEISLMVFCAILSGWFGIKIAIPLFEQSIIQKLVREYLHKRGMLSLLLVIPYSIFMSNLVVKIINFTDSLFLSWAFFCFILMIFAAFVNGVIGYFEREEKLPKECQKALDFATLFFEDSQFNKAEEISRLGLNLLKSCHKKHVELEAKFHEILGDIYYFQLENIEANTYCQSQACNYYQEALKILENSKEKDLNSLIDKIKQKIKKNQSQLENFSANSTGQNKLSLENGYISTLDWHTFFKNREPTCINDLQQSMPDSRNNFLKLEINNKNSQEDHQEICKKYN